LGSGFPFLALLGVAILVFDDMKLNVKGVPEGIKVSIGKVAPAELRQQSCGSAVRCPFRSLRLLKRTEIFKTYFLYFTGRRAAANTQSKQP
jgi:hypothetical protein